MDRSELRSLHFIGNNIHVTCNRLLYLMVILRSVSVSKWVIAFCSVLAQSCSCPPEKLFDPIKSNYTSNPEVMSNIFNTYFVSIGQQLASKISPPVQHTYPIKVNGPKNSLVLSTAAFTPTLNRILCYLAINMVFEWVYLQHWQYMICRRISWRI